ncbi:MAG: NAD(+)/NADH kinase [Anaerolineae bacterium]
MSESRPRVGIIANPASGKDIRRLVAYATTVDNQGKINIVRRALVGLAASGVRQVFYMPDTHGICARAREGLSSLSNDLPEVTPLDMSTSGRAEDSTRAAELLRSLSVGCIIVLGGDGTVRAVSKGCGDVPLLAVSTGTNNVLPSFIEGTIAGLAAGYVASGLAPRDQVTLHHKRLEVSACNKPLDQALVDVAVLSGHFLGARAIWNLADLKQVIVTRADPSAIGISAIAGMVRSITPEEPLGLVLDIDQNATECVMAAYGPGLIGRVGVRAARVLEVGDTVTLPPERPLMLALDGEREQVLNKKDEGYITLRADGPWLVDAGKVMQLAARMRAPCMPNIV